MFEINLIDLIFKNYYMGSLRIIINWYFGFFGYHENPTEGFTYLPTDLFMISIFFPIFMPCRNWQLFILYYLRYLSLNSLWKLGYFSVLKIIAFSFLKKSVKKSYSAVKIALFFSKIQKSIFQKSTFRFPQISKH